MNRILKEITKKGEKKRKQVVELQELYGNQDKWLGVETRK